MRITLKAARVNAGLTMKQAAEIIGVGVGTICAWEQHPERISALNQDMISKAYGIDINNIIFLPNERN